VLPKMRGGDSRAGWILTGARPCDTVWALLWSRSAMPGNTVDQDRLDACQEAVGYRFREPFWLQKALTHSSNRTDLG